jgi:tripartite-type tricarboxylate transporter receptor subunit TctC
MPDVQKILSRQVLEPWVATPEEFAKRVKVDYERYAKLIKMTGARVE